MTSALVPWVIALRGAVAVLVLATLVGGLPRVVQIGLAIGVGVWSAMVVGAGGPGGDVGQVPPSLWIVAARELVVGATIGVLAALPLVAAATAGRLVDLTSARRGPYATLFGVLAAAVFVGIDGHVAVVRAVVESFATVPAFAAAGDGVGPATVTATARVLGALGALVPAAVTLAVPWLVTAAVVELAVGVGTRLAARAGAHAPSAAAVPAALVMMTATLVATLAVAIAALVRTLA